jgi:hypothetical protein
LARGLIRSCALVAVLLMAQGGAQRSAWSLPREGVVMLGRVSRESLQALGPVWYYQYGFEGPDVPGHARVMLVRPHDSSERLASAMRARPGALWLVGNEPNDPFQDALSPCAYARFFRWVERIAAGSDWGAHLVPAGIANADPAYAQAFLDCYQALYECEPRVVAWNVHNYILDEGMSQYDVSLFKERIVAFRDWMRGAGQSHLPLLLTEYGVLYGSGCCDRPVEEPDEGVAFLRATTRWLQETDYVQGWAWFCLDSRTADGTSQFNGDLLAADGSLSPFGQAYAELVPGPHEH